MINQSIIVNELKKVSGIKLDNVEDDRMGTTVVFTFDASTTINDAVYLLNHRIQMRIPRDYPKRLPVVFELGDKTIQNFPHLFEDSNKSFCLGTDMELRWKLKPNYFLSDYIGFIAQFLGTYCYYDEYGVFPYGDRSHGVSGIIENYKDFFSVSTSRQVMSLMSISKLKNEYRNKKCPCNSGRKFKDCHLTTLNIVFNTPLLYSQMKEDYKLITGGK